jgi:hypothetical protein
MSTSWLADRFTALLVEGMRGYSTAGRSTN